jgi:7-cyano-7-deazaguanine synthase
LPALKKNYRMAKIIRIDRIKPGYFSKKAIVVHSGGMDSSLCLALALQEFGPKNVLSLSFSYGQRHSLELQQAEKICRDWQIDHKMLTIDCLQEITHNALMDSNVKIAHEPGAPPNTLVAGRNGLMARISAIHANHLGARYIYMGVMELEAANSGYRDCSRKYMDLLQDILRLDFGDPSFEIRTPLVHMLKKDTLILAQKLGVLKYLLKETVTCYEGLPLQGCKLCPACQLRNEGISQFLKEYPDFVLPYNMR